MESLAPFSKESGLRTSFLVTGQHLSFSPTFSNFYNFGDVKSSHRQQHKQTEAHRSACGQQIGCMPSDKWALLIDALCLRIEKMFVELPSGSHYFSFA